MNPTSASLPSDTVAPTTPIADTSGTAVVDLGEKVMLNNAQPNLVKSKILKIVGSNNPSISEVIGEMKDSGDSKPIVAQISYRWGLHVVSNISLDQSDRYFMIKTTDSTGAYSMDRQNILPTMTGSASPSDGYDFKSTVDYSVAKKSHSVSCISNYMYQTSDLKYFSVITDSNGVSTISKVNSATGACSSISGGASLKAATATPQYLFDYQGQTYFFSYNSTAFDLYKLDTVNATASLVKGGYANPLPRGKTITIGSKVYYLSTKMSMGIAASNTDDNLATHIMSLDFSDSANPVLSDLLTLDNYDASNSGLGGSQNQYSLFGVSGRVILREVRGGNTDVTSIYEYKNASLITIATFASSSIDLSSQIQCNGIYYTSYLGDLGVELYQLSGASAVLSRVVDLQMGAGSSYPRNLFCFSNTLYFIADSGSKSFLYKMSPSDSAPQAITGFDSDTYLMPYSPRYKIPAAGFGAPVAVAMAEQNGDVYLYAQTKPTFQAGYYTLNNISRVLNLPVTSNDLDCAFLLKASDKFYYRCNKIGNTSVLYELTATTVNAIGAYDSFIVNSGSVLFSLSGKVYIYKSSDQSVTSVQYQNADLQVSTGTDVFAQIGSTVYVSVGSGAQAGKLFSIDTNGIVQLVGLLPDNATAIRAVNEFIVGVTSSFVYVFNFSTNTFDKAQLEAGGDVVTGANLGNALSYDQQKVGAPSDSRYYFRLPGFSGTFVSINKTNKKMKSIYVESSTDSTKIADYSASPDAFFLTMKDGTIKYMDSSQALHNIDSVIGMAPLASAINSYGAFFIAIDQSYDVNLVQFSAGAGQTIKTVINPSDVVTAIQDIQGYCGLYVTQTGCQQTIMQLSYNGRDLIYPKFQLNASSPHGIAISYIDRNMIDGTESPLAVDVSNVAHGILSPASSLLVDRDTTKNYLYLNNKASNSSVDNGTIYRLGASLVEQILSGTPALL